jgi:hypothetical protein
LAVRQLVAVALVATLPGAMRASRRAAAPTTVAVHPRHPERLAVGTTVGLRLSRDGGRTIHRVDERAIGHGGLYDPIYRFHPERDELWATGYDGLRVSRDGGCSWLAIDGPFAAVGAAARRHWIGDLAIGGDGAIWATTSSADMTNDVFRSTDGVRFAALGLASPTLWWESVAVGGAAGAAWVSGYQIAPVAHSVIRRTDDGGRSWRPVSLAGIRFAMDPRLTVLAVSPVDPAVAFVRVFGAGEPRGDAIYRTGDGGARWTEVLVLAGAVTGFALSGDGGSVLAGSHAGGLHRSTDGGLSFETIDGARVGAAPAASTPSALAFGPDGALHAGLVDRAGWRLARSRDGGATFATVFDHATPATALPCAVEPDRVSPDRRGPPDRVSPDRRGPPDRVSPDRRGLVVAAVVGGLLALVAATVLWRRRTRRRDAGDRRAAK